MNDKCAFDTLKAGRNEDLIAKVAQEGADLDCLDSSRLFQGKKLINIIHGSECYQLRVTRQNKLLLTKSNIAEF